MEFSNCSVVLNRITDEEISRLSAPVSENESVICAGWELPNCTVVLNRITDEEIHRLCAPGSSTESGSEVKDKTGVKTRKRTRCGKKHRKLRPGKQVEAKIENTNESEFYKLKRRRFITRKTTSSVLDFVLDWSSDETKSESEKRKKKVKRRRKFKKIHQASDSSVNNALEAVVNVHSSNLNSDANSSLQSPNPSSKCDLHHQVETSTFDISANHIRHEQIDNTGQNCGIVSNSELLYSLHSYSALEDIPLSTFKNMSDLELKNILSFFNCEIQSSDKKKAKSLRRKRLKISSQNEKSGSGDDSENFVQLTKNAIKIQKLDGSIEKNEDGIICSPLLTTFKESEATFPFDHNSGGLHKSPNADWNNEMSLKSPKGKICTSRSHSGMDNLPPIDCNIDKGLKSNESGEIKREKETESQVPKGFKKSKLLEYFVEKERKTSLEVNELNGKLDHLTREGRKEENSNNKVISHNATKIFVKTNEPNEKSNHRKSQNNEDEAIIASSKQNQSERSPKPLILNKIVEDSQTVQTLDKTISNDTRKDIKINHVNITHMQKEPYIYSFRFSKDTNTDSISVTKSNLNNTSPPINISLDINKWKLKLKTKPENFNASFKPDQNDVALYLQHPYKLLVSNQSKDRQFNESFGEKTADKRLDLLNFTDSQDNFHLRDKCQKLQALESLKPDKICELYDIKKTPESTDIKDAYLFLYNSPTVLSNVQANFLHTQENFQNKIPPHKNLEVFTSPPQYDYKTNFNKTVSCVQNVINLSTTNPSEILPLVTSRGLPGNAFFSTDIPINENVNSILPCDNNSSPVCGLINPSIPNISSEKHFSTKIPTCCKKARMSDFASFDSVNTQNSEIKISNVYSIKYFENMNSHLTELNKVAPVRLDININDLNPKANETNMPIEKNSCLLSNIEREPTSEMHSKQVAELSSNDSLKQACKSSETVLSATTILDAVAVLAIADLKKNPQSYLKVKIAIGKALVKELSSKERVTLLLKDRIHSIQYDLCVLNIAEQYLNFYGSFSKVSDSFLKDSKRSGSVKK